MRYLIILLLFINLQTQSQILKPVDRVSSHITNYTQELQESLFTGPHFQQPIVYIDYSPLFPGLLGLTRKVGAGIYIIDLSPLASKDELEWVLLHELVHVWQLHTGILYKTEDSFIYRGIRYPFSFPYSIRPWELEAEALTKSICNK